MGDIIDVLAWVILMSQRGGGWKEGKSTDQQDISLQSKADIINMPRLGQFTGPGLRSLSLITIGREGFGFQAIDESARSNKNIAVCSSITFYWLRRFYRRMLGHMGFGV